MLRDVMDRHKFVTTLLKEPKLEEPKPTPVFPPGYGLNTTAGFGPRGCDKRPREQPYPRVPPQGSVVFRRGGGGGGGCGR